MYTLVQFQKTHPPNFAGPESLPPKDRKALLDYVMQDAFLGACSKNDLAALYTAASRMRKTKYKRYRGPPLYGDVGAKAMSEEQLARFFAAFPKSRWRYKVMFKNQNQCALRLGEVRLIKESHINFETKRVYVHTLKQGSPILEPVPMPEDLEQDLREYLQRYRDQIKTCEGYVYFSQKYYEWKKGWPGAKKPKNPQPMISDPFARKIFDMTRERAGLDVSYAQRRAGCRENRHPGNLRLFSTHSMRHTDAMMAAEKYHKPIEVVKERLRHRKISSTEVYYSRKKEAFQYGYEIYRLNTR